MLLQDIMDGEEVVDVNPPGLSQQAVADSDSSSVSSLSTPPTPSLPPPVNEEAPAMRESITRKPSRQGKAGVKPQKLPPHGGKCVYYQCEKCQHLTLNRKAYNVHVNECHDKSNALKAAAVVDVRAVRFEKAPVLGTCVHCENYMQHQGPILDCHQYICGERLLRDEVGDPPYVPPLKFWFVGKGFRKPPKDYDQALTEFARGVLWEVVETSYLRKKKLDHLLPVVDEIKISPPPAERNLDQATLRKATSKLSKTSYADVNVAIVPPVTVTPRRRYKERRRARSPNPLYSTLMGAVYDTKFKGVVGHLVVVGEPRFGAITLQPFNAHRNNLVMYHKIINDTKPTPFPSPPAATIALHNVKTGKVTSILECLVSPRHWEPEYNIFCEAITAPMRSPSIEVTYHEVPSELLKLFSAELLSPSSAGMRK